MDAAVILSIASAVLYAMGWVYWSGFFRYFGLRVAEVGLTFDQVIATTWQIPVVIGLIAILAIGEDQLGQLKLTELKLQGPNAISTVVSSVTIGVANAFAAPLWLTLMIGVIVALVCHAVTSRFITKPVTVGSFFRNRGQAIRTAMLLYFAVFGTYFFSGYLMGAAKSRGANATCATVATNSDPQPSARLILIARHSGTLLLTPERQPETVILIPESVIKSVLMSRCGGDLFRLW